MAAGLLLLAALGLAGCHTDMWVQPKVKPLAESDFFVDDQSSRPLVPHTVARGHLKTDEELFTGWTGGHVITDPATGRDEYVDAQIVDKIPTAALKAFDNDPKKMLEVVQASGYASPYWEFKAKPMLARDFDTHFSIDLMHKDLTLALEQANDLKVPVPGLSMVREQFQAARAAGMGGEDIAALLKVVEAAAGVARN